MNIDRERAKQLGVKVDDIFSTLQSTFGAYYVNRSTSRAGSIMCRCSLTHYTCPCEDLRHVYVRSQQGRPIPLARSRRIPDPLLAHDAVEHFNGLPAARLLGGPAPGHSSGQALAVMEQLARERQPAEAVHLLGQRGFSKQRNQAQAASACWQS